MNTVINDDNFADYFFDIRKNDFKKGQVLVKFAARAEFVDGMAKNHIIDLILKNRIQPAMNAMRLANNATQFDSIRVVKEITKDLASGLSREEVEKKSYFYVLEKYYYTDPEHIPTNDPHWCVVANLNHFIDKNNDSFEIKTKFSNMEVLDSLEVTPESVNNCEESA